MNKYNKIFIILISFIMQAANNIKAAVPEECAQIYWNNGAIPGMQSCPRLAVTSSVGLGNYYCTASQGWTWAQEYCGAINEDQCETRSGNPIQLSDGSKVHSEIDYQTKGAFPLKIERFYSSKVTMPIGLFGYKWQGNGQAKIIANYNSSSGEETYTLITDGGHYSTYEYDYSKNDGSTLPLKSGVTNTLKFYNYGVNGIPNIGILRNKSGALSAFAMDFNQLTTSGSYTGHLIWKQNNQGLQHTYTYNSDNTIDTISDDQGRELIYNYESTTGFIQSITVMPENKKFRYEYDSQKNLSKVYYPDDTPEDSDNPFKQYHYENSKFTHHLTGISDENGSRLASYTYNSDGLAISTQHTGGVNLIEVLEYGNPTRVQNEYVIPPQTRDNLK